MVCLTSKSDIDFGILELPVRPLGSEHGQREHQISLLKNNASACLGSFSRELMTLARKETLTVSLPVGSDSRVAEAITRVAAISRPKTEQAILQTDSTPVIVQRVVNLGNFKNSPPVGLIPQLIKQQLEQIEAALARGENVLVKITSGSLFGAESKLAELKKRPGYHWAKSLKIEVSGDKHLQEQVLGKFRDLGKFNFQSRITPEPKNSFLKLLKWPIDMIVRCHNAFADMLVDEPTKPEKTAGSVSQGNYERIAKKEGVFSLLQQLRTSGECAPITLNSTELLRDTLVTLNTLALRDSNRGRITVQFSESIRATLGIPTSEAQILKIDGEVMA